MLKEALHQRTILLDDVIVLCPPGAATARAYDVITWAPFFGKTKAEKAIRKINEPFHRRLCDIPLGRRKELAAVLAHNNPKALFGAAHREYVC